MKNVPLRSQCTLWAACLLTLVVAAPAFADADDPPGRVARLSYVEGSVSLQPSGETEWSRASRNYTLTTGDRLYTDSSSRAELEMGPFAARMTQMTDLTLTKVGDHIVQLAITRGTIRVTVFELPDDSSLEIDTPNGALTVLRAGSYRVSCDVDTGSTSVIVSSGSLEVSAGDVTHAVQGGEAVQLTGTDPIDINFVTRPDDDGFDQWCLDRDQVIRSCAAKRYVDPYVPGIEDLDANGDWDTVSTYGAVWFPSHLAAGWAPYRTGHWGWVEPWGWTWVGREPWGFCPYHYGRWAMVGSRWGWVPGPRTMAPVYAPALVAFVGSGGFSVGGGGVQAWFPLGPKEPYFPPYHHGDKYLQSVNAANVRDIHSLGDLSNPSGLDRIRYANRGSGTTAVSAQDFRAGKAVSKRTVPATAGPVAFRLQMAPDEVAAYRGAPPSRPAKFNGPAPGPRATAIRFGRGQNAVQSQPPVRTGPGAPDATRPAQPGPTSRPTQSGLTTRPTLPGQMTRPEPTGPPTRPSPAVIVRNPPASGLGAGRPPANTPPRVFTRNPPPPRDVPFSVRASVLAAQPGRPLEPQQKQNLREGKPAGPARDKDTPARPTPHSPSRGDSGQRGGRDSRQGK